MTGIVAVKSDTLGKRAHLAIKKQYNKILKYEPGVLEDRDPEELHQMRVNMRRLRSIAEGFSPILELPKHASEKRIAKISRILGDLRDIDVLIETLQKQYFVNLTYKERFYYVKLLSILEQRRVKSLENVRKLLGNEHYLEFKSELDAWIKKPVYRGVAGLPVSLVLPDFLFPMLNRLMIHPGWLVGMVFKNGQYYPPENWSLLSVNRLMKIHGVPLHGLRKQVKRVRYQMSFFTDLYGKSYSIYIDDMKALQESLGVMQDSLVLEELFHEVLGEGFRRQLPTAVKQLMDARYEAWKSWNMLRQKYLLDETRMAFRMELLKLK